MINDRLETIKEKFDLGFYPTLSLVDVAFLLGHIDRLNQNISSKDLAIKTMSEGGHKMNDQLQSRPTEWAYNQACAALEKHRQRADKAETELAFIKNNKIHYDEVKKAQKDSKLYGVGYLVKGFHVNPTEVTAFVNESAPYDVRMPTFKPAVSMDEKGRIDISELINEQKNKLSKSFLNKAVLNNDELLMLRDWFHLMKAQPGVGDSKKYSDLYEKIVKSIDKL